MGACLYLCLIPSKLLSSIALRLSSGLQDNKPIQIEPALQLPLQSLGGFRPTNCNAPNSISTSLLSLTIPTVALFDSSSNPNPNSAVPHQTSKQKGIFHYSNVS